MFNCASCQHPLEQHLRGEQNNSACECCRWAEPWEAPVVTDVDYDTNPFYRDTPRAEE